MFDARDGTLEAWKAEQPIGSALCLRVGCGERLDTYKEREQAASDFRFHGGGQMFLGWIKKQKHRSVADRCFSCQGYEQNRR